MALGADTGGNKIKSSIKDIENSQGEYAFPQSTKSPVNPLPFWALSYFGNKDFSDIQAAYFRFCKYLTRIEIFEWPIFVFFKYLPYLLLWYRNRKITSMWDPLYFDFPLISKYIAQICF